MDRWIARFEELYRNARDIRSNLKLTATRFI